jgi:hypothetical protein
MRAPDPNTTIMLFAIFTTLVTLHCDAFAALPCDVVMLLRKLVTLS